MFRIDKLKSPMHFVLAESHIDFLKSIFFDYVFCADEWKILIFNRWNVFYIWRMFDDDCFIFLKFDFHVIKFDWICNAKTYAFFNHDVDCFDNFIFFMTKLSLTKINVSSIWKSIKSNNSMLLNKHKSYVDSIITNFFMWCL